MDRIPHNHFYGVEQPQQMRINNFMIIETGTYNPMFLRPYQSTVNQDRIMALVDQVATMENTVGQRQGYAPITYETIIPSSIAKVSAGIMSPVAMPVKEAVIPNGWSQSRIRFILEVEVLSTIGSTMIYYFQGYSDYPGLSHSGHIDENMVFHINSLMAVSRIQQRTPTGNYYVDRITHSCHCLSNHESEGYYGGQEHYLLRPLDIYEGIQSHHIMNTVGTLDPNEYFNTTKVVNSLAKTSNRANNSSADYLARLLTSYQTGLQQVEYGETRKNYLELGAIMVQEEQLRMNPFLARLGEFFNISHSTRFHFNYLEKIDPNIKHVTSVTVKGPADIAKSHHTGQTAYWNASDYSTVTATILAHAVPSLMLDCLLTSMVFRSTNNDMNASIVTTPIDVKSLTSADLTNNVSRFIFRFNNEIIPHISFNNQELYMLHMDVNVFGDTRIDIQIGNDPMTTYTVPSFCDNLVSPVITPDKAHYLMMSKDLDEMTTYFNAGLRSTPDITQYAVQPI